jgi:hypothetical protein
VSRESSGSNGHSTRTARTGSQDAKSIGFTVEGSFELARPAGKGTWATTTTTTHSSLDRYEHWAQSCTAGGKRQLRPARPTASVWLVVEPATDDGSDDGPLRRVIAPARHMLCMYRWPSSCQDANRPTSANMALSCPRVEHLPSTSLGWDLGGGEPGHAYLRARRQSFEDALHDVHIRLRLSAVCPTSYGLAPPPTDPLPHLGRPEARKGNGPGA